MSLAIFHPHFVIRIIPSAFFYPHPIRILSSAIRHPPSAIRHPPSAIRHPPSAIRHPPSAIRHPPSGPHFTETPGKGVDSSTVLKLLNRRFSCCRSFLSVAILSIIILFTFLSLYFSFTFDSSPFFSEASIDFLLLSDGAGTGEPSPSSTPARFCGPVCDLLDNNVMIYVLKSIK